MPTAPLPFDPVLFNRAKELFLYFYTDTITALLFCVFVGFVLLGANILFSKVFGAIGAKIDNRVASSAFQSASGYAALRDSSSEGSFNYDYYNALYKNQLNKSISLSAKTGATFAEPEEPEPFTFMDGSSPEDFSDSRDHSADWDSLSLGEEGYVGFATDEIDSSGGGSGLSDWTSFGDEEITGLEMDSSGGSSGSGLSDWTSFGNEEITGLEMDSSGGSSGSGLSDWTSFGNEEITGLEMDSSGGDSGSGLSDWTSFGDEEITGLSVESSDGGSGSGLSDWTSFGDEEIAGLRLETPEDRLHHVLDNFTDFSNSEVFNAIDGLDENSSDLSDWTSFQPSDITGLEMDQNITSVRSRSDFTLFMEDD